MNTPRPLRVPNITAAPLAHAEELRRLCARLGITPNYAASFVQIQRAGASFLDQTHAETLADLLRLVGCKPEITHYDPKKDADFDADEWLVCWDVPASSAADAPAKEEAPSDIWARIEVAAADENPDRALRDLAEDVANEPGHEADYNRVIDQLDTIRRDREEAAAAHLQELTIREYTAPTGCPGLDRAPAPFYLHLDGMDVAGPFATRSEAFDRGIAIESTPGELQRLRRDLAR